MSFLLFCYCSRTVISFFFPFLRIRSVCSFFSFPGSIISDPLFFIYLWDWFHISIHTMNDDFSIFQWFVLCCRLCSYVESFSYLACIITTTFLFVNPQHLTNFFVQNCKYSIRTDARQTNQSGHHRKNLTFFCVCPAITHEHTKRSRSFSPKRSAPVPQ